MSLKISEHFYDGVPLTIYEQDNLIQKPLIYFFHGFTGNKDANIMGRGEILANLGFYVVAIDAYLHGKRMSELEKKRSNIEKYEDIVEIAIHTAEDAKRLFHKYFKHIDTVQKDLYYAYGVSMGSLTSFYLATIEPQLKGLVGLVCTPSMVDYYKDKAQQYHFNDGFFYEKKLIYYETLDPLKHPERLHNKSIFMGVGTKDEVVKPIYAEALHKLLPETTLKHYDTGHVSTKEMLEDSFNFIKEVAHANHSC